MSSSVSTSSETVMSKFTTPQGIRVSYRKSGNGPPLVLVHGGFSDHLTNWEFVEPILGTRFTLYAMARRNRGGTEATRGHALLDEAHDVVALMEHVGEPVFLLGHSYGAQCALSAARLAPECVRKLVLYEPPRPGAIAIDTFAALERLAARGDWDGFAFTFFRDTIAYPRRSSRPCAPASSGHPSWWARLRRWATCARCARIRTTPARTARSRCRSACRWARRAGGISTSPTRLRPNFRTRT